MGGYRVGRPVEQPAAMLGRHVPTHDLTCWSGSGPSGAGRHMPKWGLPANFFFFFCKKAQKKLLVLSLQVYVFYKYVLHLYFFCL